MLSLLLTSLLLCCPWFCWLSWCCSSPCCCWLSWHLVVASVPAHPGVSEVNSVHCTLRHNRLSDYWTMTITLLLFFAIGLLDYDYRTVIIVCYRTISISTIGLENFRNGLLDVEISDSQETISCPALLMHMSSQCIRNLLVCWAYAWHKVLKRS